MVVRMRHTRSHTGNRRSHHALKATVGVVDKETGLVSEKHRANLTSGTYRGKKVAYLQNKLDKKLSKINKKSKASKK